jgi:hypothetical protein
MVRRRDGVELREAGPRNREASFLLSRQSLIDAAPRHMHDAQRPD